MLEIIPGSYLAVTPYGAWRAVSRADDSIERRILQAILCEAQSPMLSAEAACAWTGPRGRPVGGGAGPPTGAGRPRAAQAFLTGSPGSGPTGRDGFPPLAASTASR